MNWYDTSLSSSNYCLFLSSIVRTNAKIRFLPKLAPQIGSHQRFWTCCAFVLGEESTVSRPGRILIGVCGDAV